VRAIGVLGIVMAVGCAPAAVAPVRSGRAPEVRSTPPALGPAAADAAMTPPEACPDRDPMARGVRVSFVGEVPDDRDGDGVLDVLDLCPEVPADRMDGCLPQR